MRRIPTTNSPPEFPARDKSQIFVTERLQLAIYLHATERLCFSHCEQGKWGKVRFVFLDPEESGAQQELEFERGALCSATVLFASQKFMRRKMSEILDKRKYGESIYGVSK